MAQFSGETVVGVGSDKRVAPECLVRYRCMVCQTDMVLDAYHGPPTCKTTRHLEQKQPVKVFMRPVSLAMARPEAEDMRGVPRKAVQT